MLEVASFVNLPLWSRYSSDVRDCHVELAAELSCNLVGSEEVQEADCYLVDQDFVQWVFEVVSMVMSPKIIEGGRCLVVFIFVRHYDFDQWALAQFQSLFCLILLFC